VAGAPVVPLIAVAAVWGASVPPISASMRALWAGLVHEESVEAAYAFDSVALESSSSSAR